MCAGAAACACAAVAVGLVYIPIMTRITRAVGLGLLAEGELLQLEKSFDVDVSFGLDREINREGLVRSGSSSNSTETLMRLNSVENFITIWLSFRK